MASPSHSTILGLAVAIILALLVVVGAMYLNNANQVAAPTATPLAQEEDGQVAGERVETQVPIDDDDPTLGDPEAPVTIIEFSDFQCPYCWQFHQTTFKQVVEEYVDTGQAQIVFKDFPLSQIHPEAEAAALAAQCAHEQDKFWEYADILFANQSALSLEDLRGYAEQLLLDPEQFTHCVASEETTKEVTDDQRAGIQVGVTGTPGFLINNILIEGALPYEEFKQVIEAELGKASPAPSP